MPEFQVLDKGFVELIDHMGSDLSVVNSARISFNRQSHTFVQEDEGLLNYLMKNRHGTPFEHNSFCFRVKAPIFVFREWHRHRIASINEMSARYMELPADWYIPKLENVRVRVGKPGHYTYEPAASYIANTFITALDQVCKESYECYQQALVTGIAPEQARLFLHVNHYSEMYWTVNARSLMNFLSLRNAPTAQWEIMQYAVAIERLWAQEMPYTAEAFTNNGRVAP